MNKIITEDYIQGLLNPSTHEVLNNDVEDLINLNQIIDLINYVKDDPQAVSAYILKYTFALKLAAAQAKEDTQKTLDKRQEYYDSRYKIYSQNNDSNPYFGVAKLTGAFIEAAIKTEAEYQELNTLYHSLKGVTDKLYSIKEGVEAELDLVQTLTANLSSLPQSGIVFDDEEIEEHVEAFKKSINS